MCCYKMQDCEAIDRYIFLLDNVYSSNFADHSTGLFLQKLS